MVVECRASFIFFCLFLFNRRLYWFIYNYTYMYNYQFNRFDKICKFPINMLAINWKLFIYYIYIYKQISIWTLKGYSEAMCGRRYWKIYHDDENLFPNLLSPNNERTKMHESISLRPQYIRTSWTYTWMHQCNMYTFLRQIKSFEPIK